MLINFLFLFNPVIGHVSDGTTAKRADSLLPPPSPVSALSQSTNTTGSTLSITDKNGMAWVSPGGGMALVNSDSRSSSSNVIKNSENIPKMNKSKSESSNSKISGFRFYEKMQADSPVDSLGDRESQSKIVGPETAQNTDLTRNPSISSSSPLSSSSSSVSEDLLTNNATNPFVPPHQQQQDPPRKNYPYIDMAASPNVTALLGKTAYLSCRVKNLGDKTVSKKKLYEPF